MNLQLYPLDTQTCELLLASCKYRIRKVIICGVPWFWLLLLLLSPATWMLAPPLCSPPPPLSCTGAAQSSLPPSGPVACGTSHRPWLSGPGLVLGEVFGLGKIDTIGNLPWNGFSFLNDIWPKFVSILAQALLKHTLTIGLRKTCRNTHLFSLFHIIHLWYSVLKHDLHSQEQGYTIIV